MKCEPVFFQKVAVLAFLGNQGKPKTKDYEFVAALIIHRFCEKRWGKDCWIGFRIRPELSNSLPDYNSEREIGLAEIVKFFHGGIDEDSPVDFFIAKRASLTKAQGMAFQVKRFGIGRDKKDTDEIIAYLNSFSKKYSKANTNLLVCLDDWVSIDMKKLYAGVNITNFPFNRIMFTWVSNDMAHLREVYPQGGEEKYPMTDLFTVC